MSVMHFTRYSCAKVCVHIYVCVFVCVCVCVCMSLCVHDFTFTRMQFG